MRHQDLTINHRLESFVYANKTDRENATGFVAGDVGRIAYQSNSGQYFRLLTVTPTWGLLDGAGVLAYATMQTAALAPASTTSTTGVMMGMGATAKITPAVSGKVHFIITGNILNTVANIGSFASAAFGSGTPPANGAAPAGTAIGTQARNVGNPKAANFTVPFTLAGVNLTPLVIGTEYWIDVILSTVATGTANIAQVIVTAIELP